jgi:hypothetical protein
LPARIIAKLSHNISTKEVDEVVINSDAEEQCTSVSDRGHTDTDTTKEVQQKKSRNRDMLIQFNVSDSALNHVLYLISYQPRLFIISPFSNYIYR